MSDLISVIVPVYNVEQYLRKCLESLRLQTYKNIEVIMIDDGSQDQSAKICEEYAKMDSRFVVIYQNHMGVLYARNRGIESAKGKYIGFVDSDDWIDLEMYENMNFILHKSDVQIVACKMKIYDNEQKIWFEEKDCLKEGKYSLENSDLVQRLFFSDTGMQEFSLNLWNKLFDRNLIIDNYKKVDKRLYYFEDLALTIYCMVQAKHLFVLNKSFYYYRQRKFSLCHSIEKKYLEQVSIFYNSIFNIASQDDALQGRLDQFFVDRVIYGLNHKMDLKLKKEIPYWIPPFKEILGERRIVLYGAGEVGRSYYQMFQYVNPEQIVLWVDKRSKELKEKGYCVDCIAVLYKTEFDKVLLAVKSEDYARQIKEELLLKGIAKEKIVWFRPKSILEREEK